MAVLKEAVTDMATLVSEQTEDLEHSQKNVQQTQVTVEKAEKDLKDVNSYAQTFVCNIFRLNTTRTLLVRSASSCKKR